MQDAALYLKESFGSNSRLQAMPAESLKKLPLFIKINYKLYSGKLEGHDFIWAIVSAETDFTPEQLKKQSTLLKDVLGAPVIYVFDRLESWQRKRLIEKRIAFIQPYKQVYIPELLLQLSDVSRHESTRESVPESISFPSQFALLYHLQVEQLEDKLLKEIATILHYSTMTVSRIIKELEEAELLTTSNGKEKAISFSYRGRQLWEKALPLMRTPIRETWMTDAYDDANHFLISGETALAHHSMLNESIKKTLAIGKDEFRSLKTLDALPALDKKYGDYKIDVWHYNPVALSKHKVIDKLSLYLTMKEHDDERIQGALRDMINEILWWPD